MKQKIFDELFNKIPENGSFVIFGACKTGADILNDLKIYKPKTQVLGFIDNIIKGPYCNLPVWTLSEFVKLNLNCDLVIMATQTNSDIIINCLDVYDIPVLPQTPYVSKYYRHKVAPLNEEQNSKYEKAFSKIIDMFHNQKDKETFEMLYKIRRNKEDVELLETFFLDQPINKYHTYCLIKNQYMDNINKNAVKNLFDVGFHDGFNVVAYDKLLPNLEKIYGFEVIYDVVRKKYIEDFFPKEKLEIVPYALGNECKKLNFYINRNHLPGSFVSELAPTKSTIDSNLEHRFVNVITMDSYCENNNIRPDLIKMDIEGAELSALKGGINSITKYRPQLAISIYHGIDDFIDIPLYLKENLSNYTYAIGHYSAWVPETVLYAIPKELCLN